MAEIARCWGTPNLLAAAQILDQSIARMRVVTHARVLLETALVRISLLEDLQQIADLISDLRSGQTPAPSKKKRRPEANVVAQDKTRQADASGRAKLPEEPTAEPPAVSVPRDDHAPPAAHQAAPPPSSAAPANLTPSGIENSDALWLATIDRLEGIAADHASQFESTANFAPNRLAVTFPAMYTSSMSFCQRPERQGEIEKILSEVAGKKLKLEFAIREDGGHVAPPKPAISARQRERQVSQQPFVQRAMELFSADVTSVSAAKRND